MSAQYRLTVVGPGDEVLDVVPLDGLDLRLPGDRAYLPTLVGQAMGSRHAVACAALPSVEEDS